MDLKSLQSQVASAVIAALIIFLAAALWQSTTGGGLIRVLGGATAAELKGLTDRLGYVNDRFENMELMITTTPHGCGNPSPPACPQGWIDMDVRFQNTYNGGDCGLGTQYRLCIRASE